MSSFYSKDELNTLGLKECGKNVRISRKTSFYGVDQICIGDDVRIDDFCILSGNIELGNHIHISAGVYLYGGDAGIRIGDFATISSRCAIYAANDDYSGEFMACSAIDEKYRNVTKEEVVIEKHAAIGTGTTVLPVVVIHEGGAVGAMSLVKEDIEGWTINAGVPCRKIKERSKNLLKIEEEFRKNNK